MTSKRPTDKMGDAVRAVFRPTSPVPTDRVRVAVLYPGDEALNQAITDAGLEVTYSHIPEHHDEKLDFGKIPDFDLVVANLPEDAEAKVDAMRYVSRYLYVRRPVSFVLVCEGDDAEFQEFAHERTWRMGYTLSTYGATAKDWGGDERRVVLIGALPGHAPPWPSGLQVKSDDYNEGPEGSLDKYQEVSGRPALGLEQVIRTVAQHVREEAPYFDSEPIDGQG